MRLHTDVLNAGDIYEAARETNVGVEICEPHGSRSRTHAYEVQLSGSSPYSAQSGQWKAATWDEWGEFLLALFNRDPAMIAGQASKPGKSTWGYDGIEEFYTKTAERHADHQRWEQRTGEHRKGHTAPWLARMSDYFIVTTRGGMRGARNCPHVILDPRHYREDGSCKCNDPAEQAWMIQEWGYSPADFSQVSP